MFLHGELELENNMSQPKGFVIGELKTKVCLLKKCLYGPKQTPKLWYRKFNEFTINFGCRRSECNWCINFRVEGISGYIYYYILMTC